MSDAIEDVFRLVRQGELDRCIQFLEDGLRCLTKTAYHAILGRDFLHHVDEAAEFIADFFRSSSSDGKIGAMYFEMNGFTINPDHWCFHGFAFKKGGKIERLKWETEWLTNWQFNTEEFPLTGMERVQSAFERWFDTEDQPLGIQLAGEITEHLVVARFNELICAAHRAAKEICPKLDKFPIVSTAHEWEILCPST